MVFVGLFANSNTIGFLLCSQVARSWSFLHSVYSATEQRAQEKEWPLVENTIDSQQRKKLTLTLRKSKILLDLWIIFSENIQDSISQIPVREAIWPVCSLPATDRSIYLLCSWFSSCFHISFLSNRRKPPDWILVDRSICRRGVSEWLTVGSQLWFQRKSMT